MGYIKFIQDGIEKKLYCGYMTGIVVTNGSLNPALSKPRIQYLGDRFKDVVDIEKPLSIEYGGIIRNVSRSSQDVYTIPKNTKYAYVGGSFRILNTPLKADLRHIIRYSINGVFSIQCTDGDDNYAPTSVFSLLSPPTITDPVNIGTRINNWYDMMAFQTNADTLLFMSPTNFTDLKNLYEQTDGEEPKIGDVPFNYAFGKWRYLTQHRGLYTNGDVLPVEINTLRPIEMSLKTIARGYSQSTIGCTWQNYLIKKYTTTPEINHEYISYSIVPDFILYNNEVTPPPNDGEDEGGGDGEKDDTSDTIDPPVPSPIIPTKSKLFTLYRIQPSQLDDIGSLIWNKSFVDTIFGVNVSPIDTIIDMYALPIGDIKGTYTNIAIGNKTTEISAQVPNTWFISIDAGSIYIQRYYDDFVDYNEKYNIYLPFIGFKEISNIILGSSITLQYNIDLLTGNCAAIINVMNDKLKSATYIYEGNCSYNIPYTAQNLRNQASKRISGVEKFVNATASANPVSMVTSVVDFLNNELSAQANILTQDSGGCAGYLGIMTPFIIVYRIKKHMNNYAKFNGNIVLSDSNYNELIGYTEIYSPHMEIAGCTEYEKNEIERLLASGVIF